MINPCMFRFFCHAHFACLFLRMCCDFNRFKNKLNQSWKNASGPCWVHLLAKNALSLSTMSTCRQWKRTARNPPLNCYGSFKTTKGFMNAKSCFGVISPTRSCLSARRLLVEVAMSWHLGARLFFWSFFFSHPLFFLRGRKGRGGRFNLDSFFHKEIFALDFVEKKAIDLCGSSCSQHECVLFHLSRAMLWDAHIFLSRTCVSTNQSSLSSLSLSIYLFIHLSLSIPSVQVCPTLSCLVFASAVRWRHGQDFWFDSQRLFGQWL